MDKYELLNNDEQNDGAPFIDGSDIDEWSDAEPAECTEPFAGVHELSAHSGIVDSEIEFAGVYETQTSGANIGASFRLKKTSKRKNIYIALGAVLLPFAAITIFSFSKTNVDVPDDTQEISIIDKSIHVEAPDYSQSKQPAVQSMSYSSGNNQALRNAIPPTIDAGELELSSNASQEKFPVMVVDGVHKVVFLSAEDYEWTRTQLLDEFTAPVAGGDLFKRGFVNIVNISSKRTGEDAISKEEALEILRPIIVVKVREKVYVTTRTKYDTQRVEDPSVEPGKVVVASEGQDGVREEEYEVVSHSGVEVERRIVNARIVKVPISRVELVGVSNENANSAPPEVAPENSPTPSPKTEPSSRPKATPIAQQAAETSASNTKTTSEINQQVLQTGDLPVYIPEETPSPDLTAPDLVVPTPSAKSTKSAKPKGAPSSSFSAFNYSNPTEVWESNPNMGAGVDYPGVNLSADSRSDKTQGIPGPQTSIAFSKPAEQRISSYFGWRESKGRVHYGLDYIAEIGTPIQAAASGTVTWYTNHEGSQSFGKVIEINHGNGFTSLYAHCDSISVFEGDYVEKDQIIGYTGTTATTVPHLHFEIRHNGIPYNPFLGYLNK